MDELLTHKITTIVAWIFQTYAVVRYFGGRQPFSDDYAHHVADNPFTVNLIVTIVYWSILLLLQVLFVTQIFVPVVDTAHGVTNRLEYTKKVGWHFSAFNFLVFGWVMLFVRQHYIWSQLFLLVNLLNILALYVSHKTYAIKPLANYFLIHVSTAAMPMVWLLFTFFWNGAVIFHIHKLVGRIIANMLVWLLFVIPGFFTLAFNDWATGLSASGLAYGLGLGQLFTKAFALQWIFGFIISALLLVLSLAAASGRVLRNSSSESAPLLSDN